MENTVRREPKILKHKFENTTNSCECFGLLRLVGFEPFWLISVWVVGERDDFGSPEQHQSFEDMTVTSSRPVRRVGRLGRFQPATWRRQVGGRDLLEAAEWDACSLRLANRVKRKNLRRFSLSPGDLLWKLGAETRDQRRTETHQRSLEDYGIPDTEIHSEH